MSAREAETSTPRLFAVVAAGGRSRRMGGPNKLALPLHGTTVLGCVVRAVAESACERTVVVLGPRSHALADDLREPSLRCEPLLLPSDTPDMKASVLAGIEHLGEVATPSPGDALLVVLGDHPTIRAGVIDALWQAHRVQPGQIRVPIFGEKRGHPLLLPWERTPEIAALPEDRGIDELLRRHASRVVAQPVSHADVLDDLDVPADYERLRHAAPDGFFSDT